MYLCLVTSHLCVLLWLWRRIICVNMLKYLIQREMISRLLNTLGAMVVRTFGPPLHVSTAPWQNVLKKKVFGREFSYMMNDLLPREVYGVIYLLTVSINVSQVLFKLMMMLSLVIVKKHSLMLRCRRTPEMMYESQYTDLCLHLC